MTAPSQWNVRLCKRRQPPEVVEWSAPQESSTSRSPSTSDLSRPKDHWSAETETKSARRRSHINVQYPGFQADARKHKEETSVVFQALETHVRGCAIREKAQRLRLLPLSKPKHRWGTREEKPNLANEMMHTSQCLNALRLQPPNHSSSRAPLQYQTHLAST